jgi:hypothetical protein
VSVWDQLSLSRLYITDLRLGVWLRALDCSWSAVGVSHSHWRYATTSACLPGSCSVPLGRQPCTTKGERSFAPARITEGVLQVLSASLWQCASDIKRAVALCGRNAAKRPRQAGLACSALRSQRGMWAEGYLSLGCLCVVCAVRNALLGLCSALLDGARRLRWLRFVWHVFRLCLWAC